MTEQIAQPVAPVLSPPQAIEFLYRAGTLLATSLDYEHCLRQVAQLAVPEVADWCAVYVVEDSGVGREITSEHPDRELEDMLLEIRRRRREGELEERSETLHVVETGEPVLVSDVRGAGLPDVPPDHQAGLERLDARSYMIVPLLARGRVMGALTFLSTQEGRHYTPDDLHFARTLAARCALNIDNARLYETAARSLAQLNNVFSTAPVGLAFLDCARRIIRINAALAEMSGRPVEDHHGRTLAEVLPPEQAERVGQMHRTVVDTGEPLLHQEASGELPGFPGEIRHWLSSFTPLRSADGEIIGVGVAVVDITERRKLLEAEREARQRADALARAEREAHARADFLARAGAMLDSSLDYQETLANVARIAVPEIADWCSVTMLDADGGLHPVAIAHADPDKEKLARQYSERYPPDPQEPGGMGNVIRTGTTDFTPEITEEMLVEALADKPEQLEMIRALELRSAIIAPLVARERVLGTISLLTAESDRRFTDADVQLAEELARRAGLAIDNARLYTERTRIAHTLQVKLLPERLPRIPGARLAARYRAAGELNEVGGDFYDVIPRSPTEWALVVGDVSGKGAEAAAITALARYTLRAAAMEPGPPSRALARLNATMMADRASQFATVVLAYVSPNGDGLNVRLSLGGHPPPLIMRGDGEVVAHGVFGSVLGVVDDPNLEDSTLSLGPSDAMLLYTDGVTEAGSRQSPLGQEGLSHLLGGLVGAPAQEIVDRVEQAVVDAQEGDPRDDIALLALSVER